MNKQQEHLAVLHQIAVTKNDIVSMQNVFGCAILVLGVLVLLLALAKPAFSIFRLWIDNRGRIPAWVRWIYPHAHFCPEMDGLLILTEQDRRNNCFCRR